MGGPKEPWINAVHRQDNLRRSPGFIEDLIVNDPQVISEPNDGSTFTSPPAITGMQVVPLKCLISNVLHFSAVNIRDTEQHICLSCPDPWRGAHDLGVQTGSDSGRKEWFWNGDWEMMCKLFQGEKCKWRNRHGYYPVSSFKDKSFYFFSFFKEREWSRGAGKLPRGSVICSSVDSFWPLDVTYWSLLQRFLTNTRLEPDSAAQMLMVQGDIIGSCSTRFTQKSAIPQRGAICARDHWIGQDQSRSEIEAFSFKT